MLRYSIAQGILSNQNLIVIGSSLDEGGDPEKILDRLMSLDESELSPNPTTSGNHQPSSSLASSSNISSEKAIHEPPSGAAQEEENEDEDEDDRNADKIKSQRMKIAWRYENLGHHHSESESIYQQSKCHTFNLSKTMKLSADQRSRTDYIDVKNLENLPSSLLTQIENIIQEKRKTSSSSPSFRIVIQSIGSIGWPPMEDFAGHISQFSLLDTAIQLLFEKKQKNCRLAFSSTPD